MGLNGESPAMVLLFPTGASAYLEREICSLERPIVPLGHCNDNRALQ